MSIEAQSVENLNSRYVGNISWRKCSLNKGGGPFILRGKRPSEIVTSAQYVTCSE